MNIKKTKLYGYGSIVLRKDKTYEIDFVNPITQERIRNGASTESKAVKILQNNQLNFYSANKFLLPKFIVIAKELPNKPFAFYPMIGNKKIFCGSYSLLQEAIEAKREIISRMID